MRGLLRPMPHQAAATSCLRLPLPAAVRLCLLLEVWRGAVGQLRGLGRRAPVPARRRHRHHRHRLRQLLRYATFGVDANPCLQVVSTHRDEPARPHLGAGPLVPAQLQAAGVAAGCMARDRCPPWRPGCRGAPCWGLRVWAAPQPTAVLLSSFLDSTSCTSPPTCTAQRRATAVRRVCVGYCATTQRAAACAGARRAWLRNPVLVMRACACVAWPCTRVSPSAVQLHSSCPHSSPTRPPCPAPSPRRPAALLPDRPNFSEVLAHQDCPAASPPLALDGLYSPPLQHGQGAWCMQQRQIYSCTRRQHRQWREVSRVCCRCRRSRGLSSFSSSGPDMTW